MSEVIISKNNSKCHNIVVSCLQETFSLFKVGYCIYTILYYWFWSILFTVNLVYDIRSHSRTLYQSCNLQLGHMLGTSIRYDLTDNNVFSVFREMIWKMEKMAFQFTSFLKFRQSDMKNDNLQWQSNPQCQESPGRRGSECAETV